MKKLKYILCIAIASIGISTAPLASSYAANVDINTAKNITEKEACELQNKQPGCKSGGALSNIFATIANIILFLVGAVAVIMLIVGGFRYVTSNGDQNSVTAAKNTILYAIIGIVVAFLAYAAVNFVTTQLTGGAA